MPKITITSASSSSSSASSTTSTQNTNKPRKCKRVSTRSTGSSSTHSSPPQKVASTNGHNATSTAANLSKDHRATHRISLSAIRHNYAMVESSANRQRCNVIVVVKADGYGHGAIETALHLADYCGADAFAVATLEEGIALRQAFMATANGVPLASISAVGTAEHGASGAGTKMNASVPGATALGMGAVVPPPSNVMGANSLKKIFTQPTVPPHRRVVSVGSGVSGGLASNFNPLGNCIKDDDLSSLTLSQISTVQGRNPKLPLLPQPQIRKGNSLRSNRIRILVLGPPVGYPECFNKYLHYQIECTVSGPEIAKALMEWVSKDKERKLAEVERIASERKEIVMGQNFLTSHAGRDGIVRNSEIDGQKDNETKILENGEYRKDDSESSICERTSSDSKEQAIENESCESDENKEEEKMAEVQHQSLQTQVRPGTLTNVSGFELAKEVRAILISQQTARVQQQQEEAIVQSGVAVASPGAGFVPGAPALWAGNGGGELPEGPSVPVPQPSTSAMTGTRALIPPKKPTSMTGAGKLSNHVPGPLNSTISTNGPYPFRGIEDLAKNSRNRELAAAKLLADATGEEDDYGDDSTDESLDSIDSSEGSDASSDKDAATAVASVSNLAMASKAAATKKGAPPAPARKRLRWHALIDSGMGRLGFKSVFENDDDFANRSEDLDNAEIEGNDNLLYKPPHQGLHVPPGPLVNTKGEKIQPQWKHGPHKDSVSIIKSMTDAEMYGAAPIEFYGMCTHMAEANSDSAYTHEQMTRFKSILKRVRQSNVSVPTISTDNSAALLTTRLMHFHPLELLSQPNADTRGFVRTGGAIYGQRPSFHQLRAVSTLTASVRHVAVLDEGESVGYDRAYVADRAIRMATIALGFADGYPRELGNQKGKVAIHGSVFPIIGNVCMDMLMIELGDADDQDGPGSKVCVGDTAVFWGPEGEEDGDGAVRLQDVASSLNTTLSALTCALSPRIRREYVD